jgi:hypothetical protein
MGSGTRYSELLGRGRLQEKPEALEREAARFFARVGKEERAERKALALASQRSIARDDEASLPEKD